MGTYKPPQGVLKLAKSLLKDMWNYFKEVRAEMKHVSWPTRNQAVMYTIVVVIVSVVTAFYLGAWDFVFTTFVKQII